jgi:hypothetical protein
MSLFSRFNTHAFRVFLKTEGWLLLVALFPAAIYTYNDGLWMGMKVFLVFALVATFGLVRAYWGSLFPKDLGGH